MAGWDEGTLSFRKYVEWVVDHSGAVIATVLVITVVAIAAMTRLRVKFDLETSLPTAHPYLQVDREIAEQFGGRNYVAIAILPRAGNVWTPAVLRKVKDLTLDVLRVPNVIAANVVSLAAPSVRYFEEAAGGSIRSEYLMREVPETPEAIAALRARVEADPLYRGTLVSEDQKAVLIFTDFWEAISRIEIYNSLDRLTAAYRDADTDVVFMGHPVLSYTLLNQTAALGRGLIPAVIVIALLLLLSFRSLQGMLIPMLTAFLSAAWAMGFLAAAGMPLDGWNASVPILIVAVAAGHSAQMLKRYYEEMERLADNRSAVVTSTARIGPVMIAAGGTAALGFASLALFGVESIRNFGLSAAAGIGSAVVLEMTFVPALRSRMRARPHVLRTKRGDQVLEWLARLALLRGGVAVFVPAAIGVAVALYGTSIVQTGISSRDYLPRGSVALRYRDAIDAHFPGTITFGILLAGEPGTMNTGATVHLMQDLQTVMARDPHVLRTASFADLLAAVYRVFEPGAMRVPDDSQVVAQLAFLGASPAFERFTDRAYSRSVVWAYLRDDDSAAVGRLLDEVRAYLAEHPPEVGLRVGLAGGAGPTIVALNEHTIHGKLLNILAVLAVIFLVASVILRSPIGGVYVAAPIAVSVLVDFGVLGLTGVHFEMGTASVIAIGTGIGADYAIYVIYRFREELAERGDLAEALRVTLLTSGRAVLFVAMSIASGFATLAPSAFPGLRTFGLIMPLTMLASALAAVFVLPALLAQTRPRFIFGRRGTERAVTRGQMAAALPSDPSESPLREDGA